MKKASARPISSGSYKPKSLNRSIKQYGSEENLTGKKKSSNRKIGEKPKKQPIAKTGIFGNRKPPPSNDHHIDNGVDYKDDRSDKNMGSLDKLSTESVYADEYGHIINSIDVTTYLETIKEKFAKVHNTGFKLCNEILEAFNLFADNNNNWNLNDSEMPFDDTVDIDKYSSSINGTVEDQDKFKCPKENDETTTNNLIQIAVGDMAGHQESITHERETVVKEEIQKGNMKTREKLLQTIHYLFDQVNLEKEAQQDQIELFLRGLSGKFQNAEHPHNLQIEQNTLNNETSNLVNIELESPENVAKLLTLDCEIKKLNHSLTNLQMELVSQRELHRLRESEIKKSRTIDQLKYELSRCETHNRLLDIRSNLIQLMQLISEDTTERLVNNLHAELERKETSRKPHGKLMETKGTQYELTRSVHNFENHRRRVQRIVENLDVRVERLERKYSTMQETIYEKIDSYTSLGKDIDIETDEADENEEDIISRLNWIQNDRKLKRKTNIKVKTY